MRVAILPELVIFAAEQRAILGAHWALSAICLAILLGANAARAQTGSSELIAPQISSERRHTIAVAPQVKQEEGRQIPFTLSGKLESGVGQGSFLADEYARNPYFAWGVSMVPAYYPIEGLTLSAYIKAAQEVTNSDLDNERQMWVWSDLQLRARYELGTIPVLDVDVNVEGRLYAPTSLVSRHETLALGSLARAAFVRGFGPFFVAYVTGFRKNFHRYTSPIVDESQRAYCRHGGAEDLRGNACAVAGNNVSFSFLNSLSVGYSPTPSFSFGLFYGISNAFTYRRYPKDERSSAHAEGGRGQRDTSFAGLDATYRLNERISFSAGLVTIAPPKTEDNRRFRFPFYDFKSEASNLTLFYLDMTVTEFFGG